MIEWMRSQKVVCCSGERYARLDRLGEGITMLCIRCSKTACSSSRSNFFKKKGYRRHTVMNNPKIYPEVRNSRRPGNRERCSSSPTCLVQALAMPAVGFSVPSNARDESNQFFPFTNWRNKREPGKIETMDDRLSDRSQALEMIGNWPAIIQAVKWKECLLLWEAEMLVIAVRKSLLHDKKIIIVIEGVVTVV
jgi:hypothetical protein